MYKLQGVAEKKYPHKNFWQHFPNDWKFFSTVFYTPSACSYLRKITKFYSVISNFDKAVLKRDHLVNFYISLEKREKLRCLCNSMIYLRKIWHDDAENVCQVHCPLII